jgi:hypothetical protein
MSILFLYFTRYYYNIITVNDYKWFFIEIGFRY